MRTAHDIKGDESTYVAMTLSVAYDGDLSYQRRDLERFWGIYKQGPEGIFLKRGKQFRMRVRPTPPFLRVYNDNQEPRTDRLFFAKAMIYSVVAAPFVRFFGMNGFLIFHVLLLFGRLRVRLPVSRGDLAVRCGAGIRARVLRRVGRARLLVFLTPEIFNLALVFVAYFLWLYKEVARPVPRFLDGIGSEIAAAVLLGVATYIEADQPAARGAAGAPPVVASPLRCAASSSALPSPRRPAGCSSGTRSSPASSTIRAATARRSTGRSRSTDRRRMPGTGARSSRRTTRMRRSCSNRGSW